MIVHVLGDEPTLLTIVANSVLLVSPVEQHLAQVIGQLLDGVSGRWILVAHAIDHVKPPVAARLDPAGTKAAGWESATETAATHWTTAVRNSVEKKAKISFSRAMEW